MRRRAADEQVSDRWAVVHFVERADGVVSRQARLVIVGSQMRQAVVKAGLIAAGYGGQFAEGGVAWANHVLRPETNWDDVSGLDGVPTISWSKLRAALIRANGDKPVVEPRATTSGQDRNSRPNNEDELRVKREIASLKPGDNFPTASGLYRVVKVDAGIYTIQLSAKKGKKKNNAPRRARYLRFDANGLVRFKLQPSLVIAEGSKASRPTRFRGLWSGGQRDDRGTQPPR